MNKIKNQVSNFVNEYNQLILNSDAARKHHSVLSLEQLHFAICDMLAEFGYSLISETVLDELFLIFKDELAEPQEDQALIFAFILHLFNLSKAQESFRFNQPINLAQLFKIINRHSLFTIVSPHDTSSSIVYERNTIVEVLGRMNILCRKEI